MATFTNKVEALLGDSPTQADLDLALMEAAAQVYGDLGDSNIEAIATREDIPADGLSLNGRRLGGVVTEHGRAFQIDPSRKKSFRHGERTRPVYFVEGSTVYVQPDHVECQALLLDVPTTTGEAEAKDPQLQILFALQAAQHIIQERMAEQQRNIQDVGTLPNVPAAPSEPTFTYTDAAEISPTATTIGNLPAAPTFSKVDLSLDFTDFDAYFDVEDAEMGGQALQKLQTELEEAQSNLQDEQARVQAELQEYQSQVEKQIQQAQLAAQEAQQTAQNAQEVELQNAAQQLQADVQEYGSTLQQYDADLQRVQLEIEKTFREAEIDTQQRSKRLEMMAFDLRRMRSRYKRHLETYRRHHRASTPHRIVSTMY